MMNRKSHPLIAVPHRQRPGHRPIKNSLQRAISSPSCRATSLRRTKELPNRHASLHRAKKMSSRRARRLHGARMVPSRRARRLRGMKKNPSRRVGSRPGRQARDRNPPWEHLGHEILLAVREANLHRLILHRIRRLRHEIWLGSPQPGNPQ